MVPATPPPWFFGVVMSALVAVSLAVIILIGGLTRMSRGQSFWPRSEGERPSPTRSRGARGRVLKGAGVRAGAGRVQEVLRHQDGTFAGSAGAGAGSEVRANVPQIAPIMPELPQSFDELCWTLEAVRLRRSGDEPTKEAAIIRAFPGVASKGGNAAWQRASQLYELMLRAQREGKTEPAPQSAAPSLQMEQAP